MHMRSRGMATRSTDQLTPVFCVMTSSCSVPSCDTETCQAHCLSDGSMAIVLPTAGMISYHGQKHKETILAFSGSVSKDNWLVISWLLSWLLRW